jgi:hypothetical protein
MNKKGQQMTLGTIIAIVLGIAVLVFLIFGFSTGWASLWSKVTAFGGGDVNVDTITQACALACKGGPDSYCNQVKTVNYGEDYWEKGSCRALENGQIAIPRCSMDCVDGAGGIKRSTDSVVA